jgi:hypothetical protein
MQGFINRTLLMSDTEKLSLSILFFPRKGTAIRASACLTPWTMQRC